METIYILAVFSGLLVARAVTVATCIGLAEHDAFRLLTCFAGTVALYFLLFGGFWYLNWYFPIAAYVLGTIGSEAIVGPRSWLPIYRYATAVQIGTILAATLMITAP